jgi:UDP:flavonoid glycosyltransferase YjiC (YdhE family)
MARILAYTTPGRGHLYPLVPILDELRRRGHQVALRTLAAEVAAMRARGFDAAPISDRIEAIAHDDWRAGSPRAALARAVRVFAQRAEHDAADLGRAIGQERPDALLVDVNAV